MKKLTDSSESGQAIVLITLAIVALLGFTALAVDGSMLYSDRRHAQNAADAASLAGGAAASLSLENNHVVYKYWNNCGNSLISNAETTAESEAIGRAGDNDYTIDLDEEYDLPSDNGYVKAECGVDNDPYFQDRFIDIEVGITRDTRTAFAHFVFGGPLRTTVTAVTRIRPRRSMAFGSSIVALNDDDSCGNIGLNIGGTAGVFISGGGLFSNGVLDIDGQTYPYIHNGDAAYFFECDNLDQIEFVDDYGNPTGSDPDQLVDDDDRLGLEEFDIPFDCSGHEVTPSDLYGRDDLTGLYCVEGDFKINNDARSIEGTDITLIFMGGKVEITGGTNTLSAPVPDPSYSGDAIPGILIYLPEKYYGPDCGVPNQELKLNGNNFALFSGSIVAPCSDVSLEGGGTTFAFESQIIGWNVFTAGNQAVSVVFNEGIQYTKPTNLELYR